MALTQILVVCLGLALLTKYGDAQVTFTSPSATTNIWLAENSAANTAILTVAATGGTPTYTYATTTAKVAIDGSTGALTISDATLLDYETASSVTVVVTATDSAGTPVVGTATVTINVIDMPAFQTLEPLYCISEGTAVGTTVATLAADGTAGSTVTYGFATSNDPNISAFNIVTASGAITVATAPTSSDKFYGVALEASEGSEKGTTTAVIYVGCSTGSGADAITTVSMLMMLVTTIITRFTM